MKADNKHQQAELIHLKQLLVAVHNDNEALRSVLVELLKGGAHEGECDDVWGSCEQHLAKADSRRKAAERVLKETANDR